MAGDWIKIRVNLADDPAVFAMASQLNLSNEAVVGHLIRVWSWATNQLEDGHAASVTECVLDRVSGVQGMTKAMLSVAWLSRVGTGFKFPRWERHLSQGAKARALATERQRKGRSRKCHAASVTETRPEKRREEKRREEKPAPDIPIPEIKPSSPTAEERMQIRQGLIRIGIESGAAQQVSLHPLLTVAMVTSNMASVKKSKGVKSQAAVLLTRLRRELEIAE